MASLKYRIRDDGVGWRWEVFTDDGQIVASGSEATDTTARVAAMLEGMRALSVSNDNSIPRVAQ
jgi:hypothetical protein